MSRTEVSRFVTLALDDEELREKLKSTPDQAFQGYDLTDEEKSAIASGDEQRLRDAGIDPMTARSWMTFHDVGPIAPDRPDAPGDVTPEGRR